MGKYRQFCWAGALGILGLGLLGILPGRAQPSNSGDLTLSQAAPTATARGTTAGVLALANVAQRDTQGSICTGFAD
ncbi:MAG TPA: hypothetical protein IGR64_07460, partial [Leptolyngbyaceae cyanobacterium M65_K2018_010]|nr:hypothetical protein [Leptolyngbyaceae cyanobacterium M65_K2018_010]